MSARLLRMRNALTEPANVLVLALSLYFVARGVFFALAIGPYIPPDELTHFSKVEVFAQSLLLPDNSEDTYRHGLVTNIPPLYYWLFGRLLHLNVFGLSPLVYLILINVAVSCATVFYAYRWVAIFSTRTPVRILFLALLTNIPMFTFLSGSLSYDNLANLCAAAALFQLSQYTLRPTRGAAVKLLLWLAAGCLTKSTILPLAALVVVVAVYSMRGRFKLALRSFVRPPEGSGVWWGVAALGLLLAFNLALWGGNWLRHGQLAPALLRVVGFENAKENPAFVRDYIFETERKRPGASKQRLAGEDAGGLAQQWLSQAANAQGSQLKSPLAYALYWVRRMLETSLGIAAHLQMPKTSTPALGPYVLVFAIAGVLFVSSCVAGQSREKDLHALFLFTAYALVLLWLVNYPKYLATGREEIAVQGRYLFPVLAPLLGLVCHSLVAHVSEWIGRSLAVAAAVVFVLGDFPYFLLRADSAWFSERVL